VGRSSPAIPPSISSGTSGQRRAELLDRCGVAVESLVRAGLEGHWVGDAVQAPFCFQGPVVAGLLSLGFLRGHGLDDPERACGVDDGGAAKACGAQ